VIVVCLLLLPLPLLLLFLLLLLVLIFSFLLLLLLLLLFLLRRLLAFVLFSHQRRRLVSARLLDWLPRRQSSGGFNEDYAAQYVPPQVRSVICW
jgi:hypothetical protein